MDEIDEQMLDVLDRIATELSTANLIAVLHDFPLANAQAVALRRRIQIRLRLV